MASRKVQAPAVHATSLAAATTAEQLACAAEPYDVAIVGGGTAGLVAATYLARFRRRVVVLDAGQSRTAQIPRSHNYPGYPDGITGTSLLESLRSQARHYGVPVVTMVVDAIGPKDRGFALRGSAGEFRARQVLLATGATDIAPATADVLQAVREGLLRYCPVCDAYEVIERDVGVFANGPAGVGEALYLRHFTSKVTLFMEHGAGELPEPDRRRLAEAGIGWVAAPISSIRHWNGRVTVRHGDAETSCDALYCALGLDIHASLAIALGAETDEAGYLVVDRHHATTTPGLYAAGDVSQGLNQVAVAMGGAAIASSAMHLKLAPLR